MRELKFKPHYDLIVIGGGIQGCAMLWEAQSRGLKTLLVEAEDYCSQTSANSLKTIHGGIRYLQTLNLNRTWRSAKEQETLLKIAPHLVHPLPCLLPTQRKLKRSRLVVATGFGLYNWLKKIACSDQKLSSASCLSKTELAEYTQLLDLPKVTGAGFWHDAQVQHAERLGFAFVRTAQTAGADAYNYLKAETLTTKAGNQFELNLECQISRQKYKVSADNVIFCTASKTVENLSGFKSSPHQYPEFCLAVNLVLKDRYAEVAIGLQSGFAQENAQASSRLLFAAPWRNATLFGTWYFEAGQGIDAARSPGKEKIERCLAEINRTYPKAAFCYKDIMDVHAGLLPIKAKGLDPENSLIEQDLIHRPDSDLNLFVVIPTKYTTCRAIAEETIDQLMSNLNKTSNQSTSAKSVLIGGKSIKDFQQDLLALQYEHSALLSEKTISQLFINYGDQINEIIELCKRNSELAEFIPGSDDHVKAQLEYELQTGQVEKLSDFIFRRSFLGADLANNRSAFEYCANRINQFHSIDDDSIASVESLLNNTLYSNTLCP